MFKKLRAFDFRHLLVLILFLTLMLAPYLAFAQAGVIPDGSTPYFDNNNSGQKINPLDSVNRVAERTYNTDSIGEGGISDIVSRVINAFLALLGVIFLTLLIYGGYLWMTAQGNDEQVNKAKGIIRNAIIGVIIVIAAYAITFFVFDALLNGGRGGGSGSGTP